MRLKVPNIRKKEEIPLRFDMNRLAEQYVKTSLAGETENQFESLLEHWDESNTPNENWRENGGHLDTIGHRYNR